MSATCQSIKTGEKGNPFQALETWLDKHSLCHILKGPIRFIHTAVLSLGARGNAWLASLPPGIPSPLPRFNYTLAKARQESRKAFSGILCSPFNVVPVWLLIGRPHSKCLKTVLVGALWDRYVKSQIPNLSEPATTTCTRLPNTTALMRM